MEKKIHDEKRYYVIKTDRLTLVPLSTEYAKDTLEIWSDVDVVRYTNVKKMYHEDEARQRIEQMTDGQGDGTYPNHFIILLGTEAVGIIGFPIISFDHFRCGFYYQLKRKHWGSGYAHEAAAGLVSYIFEEFASATIYATSVMINHASIRILEKLGFTKEFEQDNEFYSEETGYTVGHYSLTGREEIM